ncbi:MAG: hypothetical protein IT459_02720, partial [Planctomycetes bacterium]|nr:hypothetical protein [Planctomycetota bacterium]
MADIIRSCGANTTNAIASVSNTTPVVITLAAAHKFAAGEWVYVTGTGIGALDAKDWQLQATGPTTVTLQGSTASGTAAAGNVGRRYNKAQIGTWISATTGSLGGNRYILELYDDDGLGFPVDASTRLQVTGATGTTATSYRLIRSNSGVSAFTGKPHRYCPYTTKGVFITKSLTATANFGNGIELSEPFAKLQGIGILASAVSPPSSGTCTGVLVTATDCQVDAVYVRWDQGTGTFSGRGFWANVTTTLGHGTQFTNCIAHGSGDVARGAHTGIDGGTDSNCFVFCSAAYAIAFGATPRGIKNNSGSGTDTADCIAIGSAFGDFLLGSSARYNISLDSTATAFGGGIGSQALVTAQQLWPYAELADFRCLDTSPGRAMGLNLSWTFAGDAVPKDFAGTVRQKPWDIGPYEGSVTNPFASPPPEVVKKIGSGAGRDYATIAAWESATRQDLIYGDAPWQNTIQVGELYDDSVFALSSGVSAKIDGARTDSSRYRILRAAPGNRYDPLAAIGARITGNVTDAQGRGVLEVAESYSRIEGVFVDNQNTGTSTNAAAVALTGKSTRADSVLAQVLVGNGANRTIFLADTNDDQAFTNCIALGSGSTSAGATFGFLIGAAADRARIVNCVAYWNRLTTFAGVGFKVAGAEAVVQNCIGARNAVDFAVLADTTFDHCCSADT